MAETITGQQREEDQPPKETKVLRERGPKTWQTEPSTPHAHTHTHNTKVATKEPVTHTLNAPFSLSQPACALCVKVPATGEPMTMPTGCLLLSALPLLLLDGEGRVKWRLNTDTSWLAQAR